MEKSETDCIPSEVIEIHSTQKLITDRQMRHNVGKNATSDQQLSDRDVVDEGEKDCTLCEIHQQRLCENIVEQNNNRAAFGINDQQLQKTDKQEGRL